jgi:hypothetical protein
MSSTAPATKTAKTPTVSKGDLVESLRSNLAAFEGIPAEFRSADIQNRIDAMRNQLALIDAAKESDAPTLTESERAELVDALDAAQAEYIAAIGVAQTAFDNSAAILDKLWDSNCQVGLRKFDFGSTVAEVITKDTRKPRVQETASNPRGFNALVLAHYLSGLSVGTRVRVADIAKAIGINQTSLNQLFKRALSEGFIAREESRGAPIELLGKASGLDARGWYAILNSSKIVFDDVALPDGSPAVVDGVFDYAGVVAGLQADAAAEATSDSAGEVPVNAEAA